MSEITAEQALTILNDGEPVDLSALDIVVITHGASQRWDVAKQRMVDVDEPNFWPFQKGEILLLAESGREPFGEQRKPGKWDVVETTCAGYDEAIALSEAVKAAPAKFTQEYWDARREGEVSQ